MKLLFIYLIIIFIIDCFSCVTSKSSQNCIDLEWKIKAINMLVDNYTTYNSNIDTKCKSRPEIDIYLKILDLNRFNLEQIKNKLSNYCKINSIKMDSIICFTQQYISFDIEQLSPCICYLFSPSETITLRFYQNNTIVEKIDFKENSFKNYTNAKNGCDQTLLVTTKFTKNWDWIIQKIIINSDDNIWH